MRIGPMMKMGVGRGQGRAAVNARSAYTLIEMLIAVAIIVIVIALTFPALQQARESAWNAQCQSNLHQIQTALGLYSTDNAGHFQRSLPTASNWAVYVGSIRARSVLRCPKKPESGQLSGLNMEFLFEPPPSARFNELEHDQLVFVFQEKESFTLPSAVTVNIIDPGTYGHSSHYPSPHPTVPAGELIDCFFLHYEGYSNKTASTGGDLTVPGEILGIITDDPELNATDGLLGVPTTLYATGTNARGFEENTENVTLTEDRRTFVINYYHTTYPGEDVRILSKANTYGASYGMNNLIKESYPRASQLMLTEYDLVVIDIDDENGANHILEDHVEARHFDKANTLFGDGSMLSLDPETEGLHDPTHEQWQP